MKVRWLVKRCGCPVGHDSRDGVLHSDSGYILEGQLSVLADSLGVGKGNKKNQERCPGFWPEPQVGLFIETGWIGP